MMMVNCTIMMARYEISDVSGGYGYVTTQDGTFHDQSRWSLGLRRLEVVRSAHIHRSIPYHPCRALG